MDASQTNLLENHLLELIDPTTTPEKALQLLTSHSYSAEDESALIFLAYMWFIITRRPDAYLEGIWEDIFRKSVMFSRNVSYEGKELIQVRKAYTQIVPVEDHQVTIWLQKALSNPNNCPNPYIRLNLFRLFSRFWCCSSLNNLNLTCFTFINTISEIQPHRLDANEIFFKFEDLFHHTYGYEFCKNFGKLTPSTLFNQLIKNPEGFVHSVQARFISHCIQLTGIFIRASASITDPKEQIVELESICDFLKELLEGLVFWDTFLPMELYQYIIFHPTFRPYIVEMVRDLTSAIINNKRKDIKKLGVYGLRDHLTDILGVSITTSDLPRLLMDCQLNGPKLVRHHCLLLRNTESFMNMRREEFLEAVAIEDSKLLHSDSEYSDSEDSDPEVSNAEVSNAEVNIIENIIAEVSDTEVSIAEDSDSDSDPEDVWSLIDWSLIDAESN